MLRNFTWVIPQRLAGMALPTSAGRTFSPNAGGNADLERDLTSLRELGVTTVVSLTREPLHGESLERCGLRGLHIPVEDMTAPSPDQIRRAVHYIDEQIERGGVVVHCMAGIGRTGTILAGYLVWRGSSPEAAIEEIRGSRPGSVETIEQESTIHLFARSIAEREA